MYSNAIKIAGLNDYLNPSEECVLPLVKNDNKYEIKINDRNSDSYTLKNRNKSGKNPLDDDIYKINNLKVGNVDKNKRITVGLSDCLSCSGCLTSSEEILLKDDNHLRVLERMKESKLCIVSISPQTIFMFSSYFDEEPKIVLRKLSYLFRKLGASLVFDIGLAELLSLNQSKEEFISRYLKQNKDKKERISLQTNNNNNTDYNNNNNRNNNNSNNNYSNDHTTDLPIISSHCPGWTLYAEKTLEQDLVDKISRVPSSQVIQGLLVKTLGHTMNYYNSIYEYNYIRLFNPYLLFDNSYDYFLTTVPFTTKPNSSSFSISFNSMVTSTKTNNHDKIYHICIVPCYDKKFEMVRNEYQLDSSILSLYYNNSDNTNDRDSSTHGSDNKDSKQYANKENKDKDYRDKDNKEEREKESLVDDILSTGDIGKILYELKVDFGDLKEEEIDYLFDYIYYFNKFANYKLIGLNTSTHGSSNKDNSNNNNNSTNTNRSNNNSNNNYFNSYRDCLENTKLRDLVRCSELYCQSGGFAEEIFRHSCYELFSRSPGNMHFKETINQDFKECLLYDSNNNILLRFIIAYGFKNIQNIIRLLKTHSNNNSNSTNTNRSNNNNTNHNTKLQPPVYHYIELMSCPGGCFNGAGQRIERSLVDNLDDITNFNDYFNIIINKIVPKKYQNSMKLQVLEKVDNMIKIIKIIKENTYNNYDNKDNNIDNKENKMKNNTGNNKVQPQQVDIQATSATAYEIFLKEAKYVNTVDPVCQYFSNFLKLSREIYDFELRLNSHKNTSVSLKW